MKILRLNLLAFGPFSKTILDLSRGQQGLHIVYGPNEAGKSSALRALRQMLYGIDERTTDSFVHPYQKLRVGGTLCNSEGSILEFVRRKKRGNTLMTPDESEFIEDSRLRTFLGGVDKEQFERMFGIDHEQLVKGGKEIVQGGGDVGQILFAGGSGISDSRKMQNDLQIQAGELFKPSGKNQRINQMILQFKEKQKAIQDTQLSAQEWEQHKTAYDRSVEEKKGVEADLAQKIGERRRLERIQEGLPAIARRSELLTELERCGDAVILRKNFSEIRREALTNLRVAENQDAHARKNLEHIRHSLSALDVPESLVEIADLIGEVSEELGSYRKAMKDRPQREIQWGHAEKEALSVLRGLRDDLTLDQADQLRLKKAQSVRIQELGSAYEGLAAWLKTTQDEKERLSLACDRLKKQLADIESPKDTEELRRVMDNAQKHGDLEAQYQTECAGTQKAEAGSYVLLRKLGLWTGKLEDVGELPVPSPETVETFEARLGEAEQEVRKYQTEILELEHALLETEGQIEQLRLEQEVPTEDDLMEARTQRDKDWHRIRQADIPLSDPVAESFETCVQYADKIADRLRREADRVAKKARFLSDQKKWRVHCSRVRDRLETAEAKVSKIRQAWAELWGTIGISPRSPREMRAWIQKQAVLANQIMLLREQKARAETLDTHIRTHHRVLSQCLGRFQMCPGFAGNETLANLLDISRTVIEQMNKVRVRHEKLLADLAQRERELQQADAQARKIREDMSEWQSQWARAVQPLGLDADATPAQANAVMNDINALFFLLKEADGFRKRIKGIDRDAEAFRNKVISLASQTAPELADLPLEQIVAELNHRLRRGLDAKTHQNALERQAQNEETRLRNAQAGIAEIQARLWGLCEEAGCERHEDLPAAEERSAGRQQVEAHLEQIDDHLRRLSAGATLDAFVQDAQSVNPDMIDPMMERLSEAIDLLNQQKSEIDQTIGQERNELRRMDGSARAAELAEEAQGLLARIETDVEQYVRLRVASTVLSQAIERYREKNQEPILNRSNELFEQMTRGAFGGLRLDFNEKGEGVLVGVRPGGRDSVAVEGMSDGTADQLYLSVRLASLEAYIEKNEPMPFIVDDILIKFDDDRAIATLEVLAQLSEKTQVIFFTHHQHLLRLAETHIDGGRVFGHSLGN